jgi:Domain of unknown function (DUF1918)
MHASIGDRLHLLTNHPGSAQNTGRIIEIRGTDGAPPYLVEFQDGRTTLVFPGPDALVEHARPGGSGGPAPAAARRSSRRVHTRAGW